MKDRAIPQAADLIRADLEQEQRRRRRHFVPALVLIGGVVTATFVVLGARPDLLNQPPAQLAVQVGLWGLCLFIFPAIGVGLLFPSRGVRVGLALAAIAMTFVATTGWPLSGGLSDHAHAGFAGCMTLTLGTGALLLGIGFLSGAFVQRRRLSAVFWVSAGLALMALNVITWHCPHSGLLHVVPNHLGGAALLLGLAVAIGILARRTVKPAA